MYIHVVNKLYPPRIKGRDRNWTGDRFSRWTGRARALFFSNFFKKRCVFTIFIAKLDGGQIWPVLLYGGGCKYLYDVTKSTQSDPVNDFLHGKLHIILKLRNVKISYHSIFFQSSAKHLSYIIGLTLSATPYYNEAGYDKQIGTPEGQMNAKSYNELATIRLCEHVISGIR